MKTKTSLFGKSLLPALALFAFTQCTDDSTLQSEAKQSATESEVVTTSAEEDLPVASLTIDGVHTVLSSKTNCKKCAYIVPANATVVDGKALGIKPGEAICLDEAIKYGHLQLINLEGQPDKPITVAYGVTDINLLAEANENK